MTEDSAAVAWTSMVGAQALLDSAPLHCLLGFALRELDREGGTVTIAAPIGPNSLRQSGSDQAHGGVLAVLADTAATFALSAMVGRAVPTVNMRVDYLRPANGDEMVAIARVRRAGRNIGLIDVDIESGGKLVAVARCTHSTKG